MIIKNLAIALAPIAFLLGCTTTKVDCDRKDAAKLHSAGICNPTGNETRPSRKKPLPYVPLEKPLPFIKKQKEEVREMNNDNGKANDADRGTTSGGYTHGKI